MFYQTMKLGDHISDYKLYVEACTASIPVSAFNVTSTCEIYSWFQKEELVTLRSWATAFHKVINLQYLDFLFLFLQLL